MRGLSILADGRNSIWTAELLLTVKGIDIETTFEPVGNCDDAGLTGEGEVDGKPFIRIVPIGKLGGNSVEYSGENTT